MNLIYEMSVKEAKPLPSFTGSDAMFVKITLDGQVIHPHMLALLKEIGSNRLSVMTTDDYLLLSALFREEDIRGADPSRFKHLAELEIVKYTEHGVEPVNGGVILAIGNQSATFADKMPIADADRKQSVLDYMSKRDNVTTAQLADYLGISQRTVRNILKELVENGFVDRVDSYRHAKYTLSNDKSK
jgi:ribosomal protein S25